MGLGKVDTVMFLNDNVQSRVSLALNKLTFSFKPKCHSLFKIRDIYIHKFHDL